MVKLAERPKSNGRMAEPEETVSPKVVEKIQIKPLREKTLEIPIVGDGYYMQLRFSQKSRDTMKATHEAGTQAKSKKVRNARNFEDDFRNAQYRFADGGYGIPASAFRCALISACRTVGFKMTLAKLSLFIIEDGYDATDGTPLVRLDCEEPEMDISPARNANGSMDLRCRPRFKKGWKATVRIRFDEDQFSASDVVNLLHRVGRQVGVGEGRPDSRESAGLVGYGTFDLDIKQ